MAIDVAEQVNESVQTVNRRVKHSASDSFEWIVGRDALERFAPEWDALFEQSSHSAFHMARVWCEGWCASPSAKGSMEILALRRSGELVGMLPLRVRNIAGVRYAIPAGAGRGAYLGVLERDDAPGAAEALAQELSRSRRISLFVNNDVSSQDGPTARFYETLDANGWAMHREHKDIVRCSAMAATFEEFMNERKSSKSRQSLRRKLRTLHDAHEVKVEHFYGPQLDDAVIDRCAEIHAASWMKRRGGAYLCDPFFQKLIRAAADVGLMKAWIMSLDGEDAAFVVSGVAHGVHYYEWPAFKEKFKSTMSIGQALLIDVMTDACNDGERLFDFGPGEGVYKEYWGNEEHHVDRVFAGCGARGRIALTVYRAAWSLGKFDRIRGKYRQWKRRIRKARQQSAA